MSQSNTADKTRGMNSNENGNQGGGRNSANSSLGGRSSNARSNGSFFGHSGYHDEAKLLASIKQLTTLEGLGEDESSDDSQQVQSIVNKITQQAQAGRNAKYEAATGHSSVFNRNFLRTIEKRILAKLYQINHLLLTYQAVTTPIFHIIRFFSFLQIVFNVFYGVNV